MSKRFGDVESSCNGKKSLEERLNAHPLLRDRMEMLLRVVENAAGDVEKADESERLVIEEIRQMGNAALQSWAENQHKKKVEEFEKSKQGSRRRKKKLYWHSVFGEIKIQEQTFRQRGNGLDIRPFSISAGVRCRQYSQFLQRAIVDFGSDVTFKNAPNKLKEHYGIDVPETAVRLITERHGEAIYRDAETQRDLPDIPGVSQLITEMDGSKIPVVETAERKEGSDGIDLRKTRKVSWKEARLCLAHEVGSVTPLFGATMGSADEAGDQLLQCAIRAGGGAETRFHCVGDGAIWIADQCDRVFGSQANYLVDFYHLCEYLAGAAGKIAGKDKEAWMEQQKDRLKENAYNEVLKALKPFVEGENIPDEDAPVRVCHRYISNRTHQLDYKGAIAAGLPIGSGEIESAHSYVIQARLKVAGAWWKIKNAGKMLALRVLKANGDWDKYWNNMRQEAA